MNENALEASVRFLVSLGSHFKSLHFIWSITKGCGHFEPFGLKKFCSLYFEIVSFKKHEGVYKFSLSHPYQ